MGALDHPAAGAKAGLALDQLRLLAARADVGAKAELRGQLVHLGVVVALVEAEALRLGLAGVRSVVEFRNEIGLRRGGETAFLAG